MKDVAADPNALQEHIAGTYFSLRWGIAILGILLPVALGVGGFVLDPAPDNHLRTSMSAYYWSHAMRNVFVGGLITIGAFLYLYKGFSRAENWALNLAGVLAVCVALVATRKHDETGPPLTWHGTFAVLFFLAIAFVCIRCAPDTLSLVTDPRRAARLKRTYHVLGWAMVLLPLGVAVFGTAVWRNGESPVKFFLEAAGVWVFGAYWGVKSLELRKTSAVQLALEKKLLAGGHKHNEIGRIGHVAPPQGGMAPMPDGGAA